jgi:hypothetical protein
MRKLLLLTPLLLAGCYNDSATFYADTTQEHTLSIRRQQDYFWSDHGRFTLLASRLPDCQRRIDLAELPLEDTDVELYAEGDNRWSLKAGSQVWHVETGTCSLVSRDGAPAGTKIGDFKAEIDKLTFVEAGQK